MSFRHGYYARDSIQPFDREEFLAYSRISAAAGYEFDIEDIPFKAVTSAGPQVNINLLIDAGQVGFTADNGRPNARLGVAIFTLKGTRRGQVWKIYFCSTTARSERRGRRTKVNFPGLTPSMTPSIFNLI